MTWLDFVCLALASSAIVDVWRNGSIFDEYRAWVESRLDYLPADDVPEELSSEPFEESYPAEPTPCWMRLGDELLPTWGAELLNCWFCFSHHAPWVLAILFLVPALFLESPWGVIVKLPLYCLAATRAGNIANSLLPKDQQYGRGDGD